MKSSVLKNYLNRLKSKPKTATNNQKRYSTIPKTLKRSKIRYSNMTDYQHTLSNKQYMQDLIRIAKGGIKY